MVPEGRREREQRGQGWVRRGRGRAFPSSAWAAGERNAGRRDQWGCWGAQTGPSVGGDHWDGRLRLGEKQKKSRKSLSARRFWTSTEVSFKMYGKIVMKR